MRCENHPNEKANWRVIVPTISRRIARLYVVCDACHVQLISDDTKSSAL